MSVTFKLYFTLPSGKQEIRRFTPPSSTPAGGLLASLLAYLHATYSPFYQPPLRFLLQFDDGEDMCSISSDTELSEAVSMCGSNVVKLWCRFDDREEGKQPTSRPDSGLSTPSSALLQAAAQDNLTTFPASPSLSTASSSLSAPVPTPSVQASLAQPLTEAPVDVPTPQLERDDSNRSDDAVEQLSSEDEYERIDMREEANTTPKPVVAESTTATTSSEFSTQTEAALAEAQSTQTEAPSSSDCSTGPDGDSVAESSTQTEPKVDESGAEFQQAVEISDVTGHEGHEEATAVEATVALPRSRSGSVSSASLSSTSSPSTVIHHGVICDGCGERDIRGDRYHCTACTMPGGFDLCTACEAAGDKHPQSHILLKMRVPATVPVGAFSQLHCVRRAQHQAALERPKCAFVSDVTLADGLEVRAGESLTKVWSLKNTGELPWPTGTRLVFAGGDLQPESQGLDGAGPSAAIVPYAAPGAIVHVSIQILVPNETGRFRATFRLETADRIRFGPRIWIDLVVPEAQAQTETEQEEEEPQQEIEPTHKPEPVAAEQPKAAEPTLVTAPAATVPVAAPVEEERKESEELAEQMANAALADEPAPASQADSSARFQYASEVATLRAMGFKDAELCKYLLLNNRGDVGKVVAWLLNNQP